MDATLPGLQRARASLNLARSEWKCYGHYFLPWRGFYHGPGAPGLTSQCHALFTLERKLVLYVNRSFLKHKSRMVTAFTGREPFLFYASYLMTFRVFGVMRDIIYSRFGNGIAGLVDHSWASVSGFYHARLRRCPDSRHLTYNRGK